MTKTKQKILFLISSTLSLSESDNNLLIFSNFSAKIKLYVILIIMIIEKVIAINLIKNFFRLALWLSSFINLILIQDIKIK